MLPALCRTSGLRQAVQLPTRQTWPPAVVAHTLTSRWRQGRCEWGGGEGEKRCGAPPLIGATHNQSKTRCRICAAAWECHVDPGACPSPTVCRPTSSA
jgi:hypothetical protein